MRPRGSRLDEILALRELLPDGIVSYGMTECSYCREPILRRRPWHKWCSEKCRNESLVAKRRKAKMKGEVMTTSAKCECGESSTHILGCPCCGQDIYLCCECRDVIEPREYPLCVDCKEDDDD